MNKNTIIKFVISLIVAAVCTFSGDLVYDLILKVIRSDTNTSEHTHTLISHAAVSPTCDSTGWDAFVSCMGCAYTTKIEKPALGHSFDTTYTVKNTTCQENGVERRDCKRSDCSYYETHTTPALGHNLISHDAQLATCTEIGFNAYEDCSRCSYNTRTEIPKLNHLLGEWHENTATCTSDGIERKNCTREGCEYYETQNTPALGHSYLNRVCIRGDDTLLYSEGLEFTSNGDGTCYLSGIGTCSDTSVSIPKTAPNGDEVTEIGTRAFCNNTSVTEVILPNTIKVIDYYAFLDCTSLQSVIIPIGLENIRYYAFEGCTALTEVEIPSSVTSIGEGIFGSCHSLQNIKVSIRNEFYKSVDGNLYTKDGRTLLNYALGKTESEFVIPDIVEVIGSYSFCSSKFLKKITFSDNSQLKSIVRGAFAHCDSLESINFGSNSQLTIIDNFSFFNCDALEEIVVPSSVEYIGEQAFYGCNSLINVRLKEDSRLQTIDCGAFSECDSLASITIPSSVTSIGKDAFFGDFKLQNVEFMNPSGWWCSTKKTEPRIKSSPKMSFLHQLTQHCILPQTMTINIGIKVKD